MSTRRISEPKGFQFATTDAALETLTSKDGPRRFLVADEVGLGKTVVARTIISELIKRRRQAARGLLRFQQPQHRASEPRQIARTAPDRDQSKRQHPRARIVLRSPRTPQSSQARKTSPLYADARTPQCRCIAVVAASGGMEERALIFRLLKGRFPSLDTSSFSEKCRGNQARESSWSWALQQHEQIDGVRELQKHFIDALAER